MPFYVLLTITNAIDVHFLAIINTEILIIKRIFLCKTNVLFFLTEARNALICNCHHYE